MSLFHKSLFTLTTIFLLALTAISQTQSPTPPDDKVVVHTEEIKVNFSAFGINGKFDASLKIEDIVITENDILHQASSLRHIPANVLIVLDTGGEDHIAKDFNTTRKTARALIEKLQADDSAAIIEYHDRVEVIAEWSRDKQALSAALSKNMNFGKRSVFVEALNFAVEYFEKSGLDNRHLVLITDGTDSQSGREQRLMAIRNVLATNINVHVLSYTKMEQDVLTKRRKSISARKGPAIELPPGAGIPIPGPKEQSNPPGGVTINTDRAMMRKIKQRGEDLALAEEDLTQLADDTNGEIYLPELREDMIEKTAVLAQNIDSQYVLTYLPKRPLNEVTREEERIITITPRRNDVQIQGRRRLLVRPQRQ